MDKNPWDLKNTIICRCLFIFHTWQKEPGLHKQIIITAGKPRLHSGFSFGFTSLFQIFTGCCNTLIISILSVIKNKKGAVSYWVPTNDNMEGLCMPDIPNVTSDLADVETVNELDIFCMVEKKGSQGI